MCDAHFKSLGIGEALRGTAEKVLGRILHKQKPEPVLIPVENGYPEREESGLEEGFTPGEVEGDCEGELDKLVKELNNHDGEISLLSPFDIFHN